MEYHEQSLRVRRATGLRATLRRRTPPRVWSVVRSGWHRVEAAFATAAAAGLRILPDGVSIAVRERLSLHRPLDYARAAITLRITSNAEKLRLNSCAKEPETVEWIERTLKPGDVLYDVGANIGAYSLIAARWTQGHATVYAFEPGYATFPSLVENIFSNRCENAVVPFPVALGAQTGLTTFHYATREPGGAAHGGITGTRDRAACTQTLPSFRVDDFVELLRLRPPTHIKIDVDGGELAVLQGAANTLKSPGLRWILVEVDVSGSSARSIEDLLKAHDFHLDSDHAHPGGTTHNWIFKRDGSRLRDGAL